VGAQERVARFRKETLKFETKVKDSEEVLRAVLTQVHRTKTYMPRNRCIVAFLWAISAGHHTPSTLLLLLRCFLLPPLRLLLRLLSSLGKRAHAHTTCPSLYSSRAFFSAFGGLFPAAAAAVAVVVPSSAVPSEAKESAAQSARVAHGGL